jgi:hypothetical protein
VAKKEGENKAFWGFAVICILIAIIVTGVTLSNKPSADVSLEEALSVKDNPLSKDKGVGSLFTFPDAAQKQEMGTKIVFNEMLSQIKTDLQMPTSIANETVISNSAKELTKVYGSVDQVPASVYRVACIQINNASVYLKSFYRGKDSDFNRAVAGTLRRYYFLGTGTVDPNLETVPSMEKLAKKSKKMKTSKTKSAS